MTEFKLSIATDNDAFHEVDAEHELVRILRALADRLEAGCAFEGMIVRDSNGNKVGLVHIK